MSKRKSTDREVYDELKDKPLLLAWAKIARLESSLKAIEKEVTSAKKSARELVALVASIAADDAKKRTSAKAKE